MNPQRHAASPPTENTPPLRLLIAEDNADDRDLLVLELARAKVRCTQTHVQNKQQFEATMVPGAFDAIISDYRFPSWTGMDAFAFAQTVDAEVPFLLVTGNLGDEAAVDCIKRGVSDYILKDHLFRLPVALEHAISDRVLRRKHLHSQEALRVSEIRNRELVQHSIYGILRAEASGKFMDANPALLRILNLSTAGTLPSSVQDVYRFPEQFAQLMSSCRAFGQVHGAEAEWRRPDGGIIAVRLQLRSLSAPDPEGSVELIVEDVTELRAMERQLRQSQKFEAIGQLAGGVAHDFNNVIGAILGWAELGLEQSSDDPQVTERFSRIREQADRAASLTRELLAFARRQVLQPRNVDLNAITSGITGFLDKVLGKNIELKLITAALAPIKADPTQIEHVLMNLCLHARDSMPNGGFLRIETETAELDDSFCRFYPYVTPGTYAVLSVADTGIGMDSETREHIFEPFFGGPEAGSRGMALATVYGIVKQHGGFIHVYSEPGQGCLFRAYFPVVDRPARSGAVQGSPSAPAVLRGTETILLAEDHESIREMARHTLLALGYRVLAACDGEEALQLCRDEVPDLAVLDVMMPKLGGPATAARLVRLIDHLPVVFTSGYSQENNSVAGVGAEEHYLQKPYSPTALARLVRTVLDHARVPTPA
ncbi:MAG TPA: response regulator [Candidatus Dormibacteraeota bacterium]|nr:response regulator [Candidatus Dormibacteraeota bacterium]